MKYRSPAQLLIFVSIVGTLVLSCSSEKLTRNVPPCPPPPPPPTCLPASYDAVSIDTSKVIDGVKLSLLRVIGASSLKNEWALLPMGEVDMLLEGDAASSSSYIPVRRTSAQRVERIQSSDRLRSHSTLGTIVAPMAVTGDASLTSIHLRDNTITTEFPISEDLTPVNREVFWDGHPTVSQNGRFLVFASDRNGTMGGTDLWYSVKTGTTWSNPKLLEGGVNTPCDELSPFFKTSDSVLLFASAGHATVGGYDLFEVPVYQDGSSLRTGTPRNLGKPLNSRFDELFPRMSDDKIMYFSSNRPRPADDEQTDFDVFVLAPIREKVQPEKPQKQQKPTTIVSGTVINQNTNEPVVDADVTATDVETHTVVSATKTDTAGEYEIPIPVETEVEITAQAPDVFFDEMRVIVPSTAANDTFHIAKPFVLPEIFILRVNFPTAIFDNPYPHTLDSNGVESAQTWQEALELLASNVKLSGSRLKKLVLIGHTDDVDDDASNMTLGRNRVNFVMDELVKRGVERSLLEGRSAGETMLPSRRKDESIDVWRKRARRVELVKVLQ